MSAMRRTESVVDKNIAERRQFFRKMHVILFFFRMEADVFQEHNFQYEFSVNQPLHIQASEKFSLYVFFFLH